MNLIDTRADNAYRRLTADELATLAESTKPRTERVQEELTRMEAVFTRGLDEDTSHLLGARLRVARESLDLPEPA